MIKILLIEDDDEFAVIYRSMLENSGFSSIHNCKTVDAACEYLSTQLPDIILTEILLGHQTIFDLFRLMPHASKLPILLMTSSDDEHLYEMSRQLSNALYMVRPFHQISLRAAVDRLLGSRFEHINHNGNNSIIVRGIYNEKIPIAASEIIWVCSEGNYCIIQTTKTQYALKRTLYSIEQKLGKDFIRIHRSTLVNKRYTLQVDLRKGKVNTTNGQFPIGNSHRLKVMELLHQDKHNHSHA